MSHLKLLLMKIPFGLLILFMCATSVRGQEIPLQPLPLNDLSQFKQQAGNWQIVGDVVMSRTIDVHHKASEGASKKKKKKSKKVSQPQAGPVQFVAGEGVLLNINDTEKKDNLFTTWEHGDIDLELEVMLPKGSNSGIYLQGRYEVQLFDSWGRDDPMFTDIGGIYKNREKDPLKNFSGKAPYTNAARAPGLWQKLYISFQAPRFNANGEKIANAVFLKVILNGVLIHDNVEVQNFTGGPMEKNEKAKGPLMIQGDHGPVAFRNIRYLAFDSAPLRATGITYNYHQGPFKKISDFASKEVAGSGSGKNISWEYSPKEDQFGLEIKGNLEVPENGSYHFEMRCNGGARFVIDDQVVIDHDNNHNVRQVVKGAKQLTAGSHPFKLYYFKSAGWMAPAIGLFVEGDNLRKQPLHAQSSMLNDRGLVNPIIERVEAKPRLLRAFLDFNGNNRQRLTHTVGIGDPSGVHYIYNLKAGNVVCGWRGAFIDATPMWHNRGDGSFRPLGDVQYFFIDQPLAVLDNMNAHFPNEYKESDFRPKGYALDEATGRPVFKYIYKGIEVQDSIEPDGKGNYLNRVVRLSQTVPNLYFKIAEGKDMTVMPDGSYAVDDKKYYVQILDSAAPVVREVKGKKELIVPMTTQELSYAIIW